MKIPNLLLTLLFLSVTFVGCENKYSPIEITTNDFHDAQDQLTSVMVHDIFSPPVASRIYVYSNIASHEILVQEQQNDYKSLKGMLRDFKGISKSKDTLVNHKLAALVAFLEVGKSLIFSQQMIMEYEEKLFSNWEKINPKVYLASKVYAEKVSDEIRLWYKSDNYNESRTYPKFTVDYDSPSRWQPTPPDYMDGIEPHWSKIRPFVIESAAQFQPE
ncbi:MAG: phosphatidic acid phosphatase, partial [Flavobacteriales bacterium]